MANDETRPEDELEQLRNQKERAELKAQLALLSAPWWRRTGLIAGVTAILAAVLPVKAAIEESYRNDRELALQQVRQQEDFALQQARQEHEIRMTYLDRYEVPGHRLQTLRFLIAITTDARLLAWAHEEQKLVEAQLALIEQQLVSVAKKIEQAQPGEALDELKQEIDELNKLKSVTTLRPPAGSGSAAE